MFDKKQTCIHDSEEELPSFVNCDHSNVVGYDPEQKTTLKFTENVPKIIEEKEKLLTKYEIGSRRENPKELSRFESLFQEEKKNLDYCFENYQDIDIPDIYSLELKIKNILGQKQYDEYNTILKSWFAFEIDQKTFENSLRSCFPQDQLKLHNEYMQALFDQADSNKNVVEDFSYFFDGLQDETVDQRSTTPDELAFSTLFFANDQNTFDILDEDEVICDDSNLATAVATVDDDEDDLMVVKKRKRKRNIRFLDDDDDDDELSCPATGSNRDVENLSDDDIVPKKKRKRKAMLILSDDEDGNEGNYDSYESSNSNAFNTDSNGSKPIETKSSVPPKTATPSATATTTNQSTTTEHNFSLLSKILNSGPSVSFIDNCKTEIKIKEENSNQQSVINIQKEPVASSNQIQPVFSSSTNSKIAELLKQDTSEYMGIHPPSPLASSPATLDSLTNSDDLSNKSENMIPGERNIKTEPPETSEIVEEKVKISICKTVQNFEIFDPIMDSSLNSMDSRNKSHEAEDIKTKMTTEEENDDTTVKLMSSEEKVTKLQTCYQEVSLPDNIRLGLRISQLATAQGLKSVDKRVTHICNLALKNFIRNILTQLIISRNSFMVKNNRILFNIGGQPINPYLRNSYKLAQRESSPDMSSSFFKHQTFNDRMDSQMEKSEQFWRMALLNDSKLKIRKYGLKKNELYFNQEDLVKIEPDCKEPKRKLRPLSGMLYFPDYQTNYESSCTLYHLYDLLNSHRSLIPVTPVWSRTLYRTVAAFNNLADSEK